MKVLAVNSSPKMEKGNTALLLEPFLEGMRQAGAEVERYYTRQLDVGPCQGELSCWLKTPGQCFQQDDMQWLLPKLADADLWVLATPLYVDGMSGPMKNLVDRIIPLMQPFFELQDGHCRHPRREGCKAGKLALVSVCGLWEMDNFDPLVAHVKAICKNAGREFSGALLRPHAAGLAALRQRVPMEDVFIAARAAGRQLVESGCMSPEALATVGRELLPRDILIDSTNAWFHRVLAG